MSRCFCRTLLPAASLSLLLSASLQAQNLSSLHVPCPQGEVYTFDFQNPAKGWRCLPVSSSWSGVSSWFDMTGDTVFQPSAPLKAKSPPRDPDSAIAKTFYEGYLSAAVRPLENLCPRGFLEVVDFAHGDVRSRCITFVRDQKVLTPIARDSTWLGKFNPKGVLATIGGLSVAQKAGQVLRVVGVSTWAAPEYAKFLETRLSFAPAAAARLAPTLAEAAMAAKSRVGSKEAVIALVIVGGVFYVTREWWMSTDSADTR